MHKKYSVDWFEVFGVFLILVLLAIALCTVVVTGGKNESHLDCNEQISSALFRKNS